MHIALFRDLHTYQDVVNAEGVHVLDAASLHVGKHPIGKERAIDAACRNHQMCV